LGKPDAGAKEKGSMVKGERSRRVNRRNEILRAAEKLILSRGLSRTTTRQIAEEAGCSEGALYVHFKGRLELLLAMLEDSLPEMLKPLEVLQKRVGRGSPQANLEAALRGIFKFHLRVTPALAGLFADPELHAAFRASLARQNKGPHLSMRALEGYLAAERSLGRIDRRVEPNLVAYLLMASSFFRAFNEQFFRRTMRPGWEKFLKQLVGVLVPAASSNKQRRPIPYGTGRANSRGSKRASP
jgi:AcrR family transcriptional regulator